MNDCDVVAFKNDALIIIELKLNLNISLLTQAVKRQRYTPNEYIAIPKPEISIRKWLDLVHLVRRLEIGLILVDFEGKFPASTLYMNQALSIVKEVRNKVRKAETS
ncbi:hypothetical protein [Oceanobacillus sp. CAU 1775]